jgi:tungstate transport system ATP-binding protein
MTAQASTLFDLKGVSVRFGHVEALKSIDLQILQGQRVALIGSNGSGKSTLLRVLNGLISPKISQKSGQKTGSVSGTIQTDPHLRQAMLFQRPHMLRMSVQANVAMGLWLTGTRWADAKTQALAGLARVGLQNEATRSAKTLSQGQQQRVALARAWVCLRDAAKQNMLLLDEPTASMDPHAKREVEALMHDFAAQNMTLVFSSHNLGQVKRLATHVAYLEHGKLLAYLPVSDFFDSEKLRAMSPEADGFLRGETA